MPNIEIVGVFKSNNLILRKARVSKPDIILTESDNTGDNFLKVMKKIRQELPGTRIVIMAPYIHHNRDPLYYLRSKADGYLDLDIESKNISDALEHIYNGGNVICPSITQAIVTREKNSENSFTDTQKFSLSKREMQVLSSIIKGRNNQEIAEHMYISDNTVKAHIQSILKKMKVKSRVQAVILATQSGIINELESY